MTVYVDSNIDFNKNEYVFESVTAYLTRACLVALKRMMIDSKVVKKCTEIFGVALKNGIGCTSVDFFITRRENMKSCYLHIELS